MPSERQPQRASAPARRAAPQPRPPARSTGAARGLNPADLQLRLGNRGAQAFLTQATRARAGAPAVGAAAVVAWSPAPPEAARAPPPADPAVGGGQRAAREPPAQVPPGRDSEASVAEVQESPPAQSLPPPATSPTAGTAPPAPSPAAGGATSPEPAAPAATAAPEAQPAATSPEAQTAAAAATEGAAVSAETGGEAAAPAPVSPRAAIAPAAAGIATRARTARAPDPAGDATKATGAAQAGAIRKETQQQRIAATTTMAGFSDAAGQESTVNRDAFRTKLREAIDAKMKQPTSESEADRVIREGGREASAEVQGALQTQKDAAAGPLTNAAASEVKPETVQATGGPDLIPKQPGEPPAPVAANSVVPPPIPPERTDFSSDRASTDRLMADNAVTPEQMQRSNEPAFSAVVQERQSVEAREAQMPAELRTGESGVRDQAHAAAAHSIAQGLGVMHGSRVGRITSVAGQQTATRDTDAAERARVTQELGRIKDATRKDVEALLLEMEGTAGNMFQAGLKQAESDYAAVFEEEKGGIGTWLTTWGDDWEELIERSLKKAMEAYRRRVTVTIDLVATYVETKLAQAKSRVRQGQAEVDRFVASLDASVAQFGRDASASIASDFEAMNGEIDQRRDSLVDNLVQQYSESQERVSALEQKLREENKSLWQRIYDATVGVIKTILAFKDMLLGVLARAAGIIGSILSDPIGFLGNLINGVQAGLNQFRDNIVEHLKKGLMGWLFGALEGAGIQLPDTFDLKGILSIVLQVLGLTYANIRARAVRLLGEETVSRLEQVAEIFKVLVSEGPAGLWRMLVEKLGNIKDMLLEQIRNWVIEKIIKAGILWLVSLLNPASAFIKACKAIYDIVMFFIERGRQILELVNAILDTLAAIVAGNIQAMANKVEEALGRIIPVAISFLASLLGLGGISEKIREIIETIQKPVNAAIDWVIGKAVGLAKAAGNLFGGKKSKDKQEEPADPEKQAKIDAAMIDVDKAEKRAVESGREVTEEEALAIASDVQRQHPVIKGLRIEHGEGVWKYFYRASAEKEHAGLQPAEKGLPEGIIEEDGKKKMKPVEVPFNFRVWKFDRTEYQIQLKEQQDGINIMAIAEWLHNRRMFDFRKASLGSGRAPESAALQQQARARARQQLIQKRLFELKDDPAHKSSDAKILFTMAEDYANEQMKSLHALHGPDQIAGGKPEIASVGAAGVNMSIGAQWVHQPRESERERLEIAENTSRVHVIQKAVEGLKLTPEQAAEILMNVRLTMIDVRGP